MSFVRSPLAWLRHNWEEQLAVLVFLAGVLGLVGFGGDLALSWQVALWGLLLLVTALLLRRGWLMLFGPVLFYELVRIARRQRYFILRTLYVLLLLGVLGWLYLMWMVENWNRGGIRARDMALFASSFFYVFMALQFALVVLLTPVYTAGAIAEEKDRKTLEFLLATDLRNREIVLGKLAARLANLLLLILAGIPVLGILQFLGGIDPNLVLAGSAATVVTMLSLGTLGILCSVLCKKPRDAIVLTFVLVLVYHGLASASLLSFLPLTGRRGGPSLADLLWFLPVSTLVEWLNAGNLGRSLYRLAQAFARGGRADELLPLLLRDYALFHGLVAAACLTLAVLRVRAVALKQSAAAPKKTARQRLKRPRTQIGDQPVMWKELHVESSLPSHWLVRTGLVLLVVGSFVPVLFIVGSTSTWERQGRAINGWVRVVGTIVSFLLLLAVAVRAAGSISGERDRQTFDSLVMTPLDSTAILWAKWVGSILGVRWGWLWLGLIWLVGMLTGGLDPVGVPFLAAAWFIYAAVFAGIGVWFSMTRATTLRATVWTLVGVLAVCGGHWLVMGLCCYTPLAFARVSGHTVESILFFQTGQTPPAVLVFLAVHSRDLARFLEGRREFVEVAVYSILGLVCWFGLAAALWSAACRRFRHVMNLAPVPQRRPRSAQA